MRSKAFLALALVFLTGCSTLYYGAMEKIGREKRDILVKRILEGKKDQEQAKKQLKTTLEAFQDVTGFEGGDLEKVYKKLDGEFKDAEDRAKDLSNRITSIDRVAKDLFAEWEKEASEMKDRSLRTRSLQMLRETRSRHTQYLRRMQQTDRKMQPVLQGFRDQVLFLKHNLNAKAIGSLKTTATKLDSEVEVLIQDIEGSMKEADSFIASLTANES